jgi:glycosyltransferase involved in cell wall biosynthesis
MKKVLILQPYLAPYRIDVYNNLAKTFDVKLLFWYKEAPEHKFDLNILKAKCEFKYEYLSKGFVVFNRVFKFDIFKHVLKLRPNIVVCHEYGFFTMVCLMLSKFVKYKVIINTDDNLESFINTKGFRKLSSKLCLNNANGIVTTNPMLLNYISSLYPRLGFNSFFYPILQSDSILKEELKHSIDIANKNISSFDLEGKKILLFIGRLSDVKGIDVLLKSYKEIVKSQTDVLLIIIGSGPEEKKLKIIVNRYNLKNKIIFTGRLDGVELYSWYNVGQIFILPSRFEPFGAVVNEALIAGNYVIVSDAVGSKFLLNEDNGLIFPNENYNELSKQLKIMIDKIRPIDKIINIKDSLSVHSFDVFTNQFKEFLLKQSS